MSDAELATVRLEIPADVRYFRSVRLAIGGLATLVGFDVESIDDLRIGVDELCAALEERSDGGPIEIEVETLIGERIRISGSTRQGEAEVDDARFAFSRQILSVVADGFGYENDGDRFRCWLERRSGDLVAPEPG